MLPRDFVWGCLPKAEKVSIQGALTTRHTLCYWAVCAILFLVSRNPVREEHLFSSPTDEKTEI